MHDTRIDVLCEPTVDDLWNKPAFILSLLLAEMTKPPASRLEWIFWVDRDTLILDQCRSIDSFLPPSSGRNSTSSETDPSMSQEINLLVTEDWNGLNNGVSMLRVNTWAVDLFSAILAFRYYRPDVELIFTEQSAMEIVMKEPRFSNNVEMVPQHWFNAYPKGEAQDFYERKTEDGLEKYHARRGDFLIHFAGIPRKDKAIDQWSAALDKMANVTSKNDAQRDTTQDIKEFWNNKFTQ